jgi:hypothetical protein
MQLQRDFAGESKVVSLHHKSPLLFFNHSTLLPHHFTHLHQHNISHITSTSNTPSFKTAGANPAAEQRDEQQQQQQPATPRNNKQRCDEVP